MKFNVHATNDATHSTSNRRYKECCKPEICPSLRLPSVCLSKCKKVRYRTLIGNRMLKVEPTNRRGRTDARRACQNGNEAVAGAVSEAFARWLDHRCAPVELPSTEALFCSAIGLPCYSSIGDIITMQNICNTSILSHRHRQTSPAALLLTGCLPCRRVLCVYDLSTINWGGCFQCQFKSPYSASWRYVAQVVVLWCPASLSSSSSSAAATVTALRWEPVNAHV